MSFPERPVRLALVQQAPAFLDLGASLERVASFAAEARREGAQIVAFPETWLPGYPFWLDTAPSAALWEHSPTEEIFSLLFRNSVELGSEAGDRIGRIAKENGIVLVLGLNERDGGTLYNTITTHGPDGRLLSRHRKLVPTYTERLVWGRGDARSLQAAETEHGVVGALVCWEHWMPLARQVMHQQQEFVHVAQWPWVKEMHLIASRQYAFEGRCFVAASGGVLRKSDLPELPGFADVPGAEDEWILRGGSCVIAPTGEIIAGPLLDEPGLVIADLDPELAVRGRMTLDVSGHYSRPDLFHLEFGGEQVFGG